MKRVELKDKASIVMSIQNYFKNNEEARFIHRLYGILLFAHSDEDNNVVGDMIGSSRRALTNWINLLNKTGDIESLRNKPRSGRPPRLSIAQKEELKELLQGITGSKEVVVNIRDGKSLSLYIYERYGVKLSVRTCQNLLHKLGSSPKQLRAVISPAKVGRTLKSDNS